MLRFNSKGCQARDEGAASVSVHARGCLLAEFLLAKGRPVFVPFRPSTVWMRPTHAMEGNLLYSVYKSNVNLIQKYPHRSVQDNI